MEASIVSRLKSIVAFLKEKKLLWSPEPAVGHNAWIQTRSGGPFDYEFNIDQLRIEDIAAALSKLNRFAGHTTRFYGVGEHSVLVAMRVWQICTEHGVTDHLRVLITLAALLHDATEAYMVDIPRPLKRLPGMAAYRQMEAELEALVRIKFVGTIPNWAEEWIHQADHEMLAVERRDVMCHTGRQWDHSNDPIPGFYAGFWSHQEAEHAFMEMYRWLVQRK